MSLFPRSVVPALFVAASVFGSCAYAQSDRCLGSLIRDASSSSVHTATAFAMSDLINSMSSSVAKQEASITIPIDGVPINLGSMRARKLSTQFSQQTGVRWNQATRVQNVSSSVSANAVEAYRICTEGQHTSGTRVYVYDETPTQVSVKVAWWSPALSPTSARATVSVSGGTLQEPFPDSWSTGTSFIRIVDRVPRQDLRIVANIGGGPDTITVPYLPTVIVRRATEEVTKPSAQGNLRLANDGSGRNQGPISECYAAPADGEVREGSASISWVARAGNIDATSYVKLTSQDDQRVCWEAFLRPLSRTGGGDMQFRIKYVVDRWTFESR